MLQENITHKFAALILLGIFLAALGGLFFLTYSIFMAGYINAGVVLGMISGIISILILFQAIR